MSPELDYFKERPERHFKGDIEFKIKFIRVTLCFKPQGLLKLMTERIISRLMYGNFSLLEENLRKVFFKWKC